MKFIFWNIRDADDAKIGTELKDLIALENPDILLLAESNVTDTFIQANSKLKFIAGVTKQVQKIKKNLKLYSSQVGYLVRPVTEYGNGEIVVCALERKGEHYLLFGSHFVSKSHLKDEDKRSTRFAKYKEFMSSTEKDYRTSPKTGIARNLIGSIAFGDFNINPFEKPFNKIDSLLALDVRNSRKTKPNKYNHYINPTMSILGNFGFRKNGKSAAPGTYHYDNKDMEIPSEYFWNALDGLFFSPTLLKSYEEGDFLEVITEVRDATAAVKHKFYDFEKKVINRTYSDHLPITFTFKFK